MAARQQQLMLFWLSLLTAGKRLLSTYRKAVEINYFLVQFIDSTKSLQRRPRQTPSAEAPGGGVGSTDKTMLLEGQTAPSWWGCLCACV